jgi:hypothetical protein
VVFGSSRDNATYRVLKRYAELTGDQHKAEAVEGVFDHPMIEEVFETREKVFQRITRESGAEDAEGRWLDLSKFDHKTHSTRGREKYIRARALLSYLCSSYEVKLMARVFGEAQDEREWAKEKKSRRPKLRIWLYHYDGLTLRLSSKATPGKVIGRLQKAARTEAQKLGLLTKLTVEHEGESEAGLPFAPARPNHEEKVLRLRLRSLRHRELCYIPLSSVRAGRSGPPCLASTERALSRRAFLRRATTQWLGSEPPNPPQP